MSSVSSSSSTSSPASAIPLAASTHLDSALFLRLFPSKEESKREHWLKTLLNEEFESLEDLAKLTDSTWNQIELPIAVKETLKQIATTTQLSTNTSATQPPAYDPSHAALAASSDLISSSSSVSSVSRNPLTQLDCILVDISSSMKAKSSIDVLKTREDVSKLVFHVLVDKLVALELDHAVGLMAFGQNVSIFQKVTREYERFHDQLGRLDANEGSTKLYDAIFEAACFLQQYADEHKNELCKNTGDECKLRIFALTDGEDNSSHQQAWKVTQYLQNHGIALDSLPLAGSNAILQAMSAATGGMCFRCSNSEQSVSLFERQAVLHLAFREKSPTIPLVTDSSTLSTLASQAVVREDVRSVEPAAARAKILRVEEVQQRAETTNMTGAVKRIYKEYRDMMAAESMEMRAWMSSDDPHVWKALIHGPKASPYEDGRFVLLIQFPKDYPFKPPKAQFLTSVYHCNISSDGHLCLDILKDNWSPALTISKLLLSIQSLLSHPNAVDPLDVVKADVYRVDRNRYEREAKAQVEKLAKFSDEELKKRYDIDVNDTSASSAASSVSHTSAGSTATDSPAALPHAS